MAKEEQPTPTPEEKLLTAIRGNDKGQSAAPQVAPLPALAPPPVAVPSPSDTASRKLKVAAPAERGPVPIATKAPATAPAAAPVAAVAAAAAAPVPTPDSAAPVPAAQPASAHGRKSSQRRFGVATANKLLAAAVVLMIGFAGFEIWSSVLAMQVPEPPPVTDLAPAPEPQEFDLPPLAEILKSFENRPIVRAPEEGGDDDPAPIKDPRPKPTPWATDLKESIKLKGFTGDEAVLVDGKDKNKMYFVTVGQKFNLHGKELTLERIEGDSVTFTDGKDRVTLK